MQDPGNLIAIDFLIMYTILGPLVLFAIYVLFDSLSKGSKPRTTVQDKTTGKDNPAVWTNEDITAHMNQL